MLDLTFKQVCELIKKEGEQEPSLIDAVDKLLGLALVCSPLVAGPGLVTVLPTLGAKNELVRLGKDVFKRVTSLKDEDYLGRSERMEMAYGLIVFTAFFDALDSQLPKTLRGKIGSLDPHRAFLAKEAARKSRQPEPLISVYDLADGPIANIHFAFPHPTESLDQQIERHQNLWKQMAQGFSGFVQRLAFWDDESDKDKAHITSVIQKVPEQVTRFFEAQYFELARTFEDFAIWANLHEHARTKQLIRDLSIYVKQHIKLSQVGDKALDIGFSKLHSYILDIPETLKISQAKELVDGLTKYYKARVNDLIIEDKEEPEPDKPRLAFPRISDAFIPQAFHVLRQIGKGRQLEHEDTWVGLPRRNDLGAFLISYLSSPYSTDTPLLILGHPGSGKSLLTTVLASQLMSKHFTVIRVLLRKVNAEADIQSQIEEGIGQITGTNTDPWAKLSGAFKNNPPLVILDGYDELLQASGKVFASYLKDVQHFQRNEAEQGRPVRVIVTSRVTLIDKATVPSGSTVVRLLEFDQNQRERWISIWNSTNANYFTEAKIEGFGLPDKKEIGAEKILALAKQPLLLLMLALYDSQDNQLRKSKNLDRTKLYDSLLRRFVERERGKKKGFDDAKAVERKKALDTEMQRLGVAALGMYNRRKVHILASELDDDLKFFGLERSVSVTDGRALNEADLLLGSFFFIHKSKAQHAAGAPDAHEEASAFEFLHNTFGEFLTADFILRRAFAEVEALRAYQKNEALQEDLDKRLNDADGFKKEWFASLVYTPLFTRPVVMEMMREWINHILKERKLSLDDFLGTLDTVVLNQLKRLLNKREMPSIICKDTVQENYRALFGDHPLLGHVAIYSMNLILLRILVSESHFVFDETKIETHEDGARPWDRLTYLWRSWFSLDNLNGITVVMTANRDGNQIAVRAKERFQVAESQNRLQTCLNVGLSLGDNVSSGLTGLILFDPFRSNELSIDDIGERLASEKFDLQFQVSLKRLYEIGHRVSEDNLEIFCHEIRRAFELALSGDRFDELEAIAVSLRRAVQRVRLVDFRYALIGRETNILRRALDPGIAAEIAMRNPQAGILLWQVAKDVGDREWTRRFGRDFAEFGFRRHHPSELLERSPEVWTSWLQLVRELNADHSFEQYGEKFWPEFFDRFFDPRYFAELSHSNPLAAMQWLLLAREFGGKRFFRHLEREVFDRVFNSAELFDLGRRHPDLLVGWLQLAIEGGSERFVNRIEPEILRMLSDPDLIMEMINRDPRTAISWVRIVSVLDGKDLVRQHGARILERLLHPRYGNELATMAPEFMFALVELVRDLGKEALRYFDREFLDRLLHPRQLLNIGENNPELALTYLQLILELGGSKLLKDRADDLFEDAFDPFVLQRLLHTKPRVFAFALRLARITESKRGIDFLIESLMVISNRVDLSQTLSAMPISAISDIHWLADHTGNPALHDALSRLSDTNPHSRNRYDAL
jgi:hypothetical protein